MSAMQMTVPLSRKAVLVAVNISQWSARKLDRKVTEETNTRYNASSDAIRANKLLLEKESLAELTTMVSKARQYHYKMTRPWADEGPRILPNVLFHKFSEEFRTMKREFADAADRFAAAYPEFIEERRIALGDTFNEADYPPVADIRSKFNLDLSILPFPEASDFRSDLDDDTVAEIKAQLQTSAASVLDGAMKHTVEEIVKHVGKMATVLAEFELGTGQSGSFRNSLVGNVRKLAELLPAFNLTEDARLTQIIERIKSELCVEEAEDLRKNEDVRESVQRSADEIVEAVKGLFG